MVQRSPLGIALGREKMQFSLELAFAKYAELSARAGVSNDHSQSIL